jgi:hypothetical protein
LGFEFGELQIYLAGNPKLNIWISPIGYGTKSQLKLILNNTFMSKKNKNKKTSAKTKTKKTSAKTKQKTFSKAELADECTNKSKGMNSS